MAKKAKQPKRRRLTLNQLRKILASFDVNEDKSAGKGSHTKFWKQFPDGRFSYPVPTHSKDVLNCYVDGCRKKFRLQAVDGITDQDFYGRA